MTSRCDKGKIVIQNGNLEILQVFGKPYLSIPVTTILGFITTTIFTSQSVSIHATTGVWDLKTVSKFSEITSQLPNVPIEDTRAVPWYRSQIARSHVGIYTDQKQMQSELAQAALNGWQIQGQSALGGHRNVGAMAAGEILAGPLGALAMSGRSKDQTTITFLRTPEWLAAHPLP